MRHGLRAVYNPYRILFWQGSRASQEESSSLGNYGMSINILVAPASAPQRLPPIIPCRPSRRYRSESLADQILKYVSDAGANPTGRWELVQALAPDDGSASTAEMKSRRAEVLQEIEALIRAGRLVRLGRLAVKLPSSPGEEADSLWPRVQAGYAARLRGCAELRGCVEVNLITDSRKRRPSSDEWHDHGRLAHQAVSFENKRGNSDWTRQCGYACLLDLRGVRAEPFGKRIFFMESPIDPTKRALQSSRVTLRRYLDSPFPTRGWGWNPFRQPVVGGQVSYVSGFWGLSGGSLPRAVGEDLGSVPSLKSAAALVSPAY